MFNLLKYINIYIHIILNGPTDYNESHHGGDVCMQRGAGDKR